MTKQAMLDQLKAMGLRKTFRPYAENESGAFMLETRRPAQIVDGLLRGSEICLQGKRFRVWTPRKRLARDVAAKHGLHVQLLDGEAVLCVTPALADELLPVFGARVKRNLNAAQKAILNARLCKKMP